MQVELAIAMWFTISLASLALYSYLLAGAPSVGVSVYVFRVPIAFCLAQRAFVLCGVWRLGQPLYETASFKITLLPTTACVICFALAGFLCSKEAVPFRSTLYFTVVYTLNSWILNCNILIVPMSLPPEPCRKVVFLPVSAFMTTLRGLDALTDLSFLRVLAVQVCARLLLPL